MTLTEDRLSNLKYYYINPHATKGDPCFALGNNRYAFEGEIMIGNEEAIPGLTPDELVDSLKAFTVDPKVAQTMIYQRHYFGEENYEPARQATIDFVKKRYLEAQSLGLEIPSEVEDVIKNDEWLW